MRWTVNYYMHRSKVWSAAVDKFPNMEAGPAAYCHKQAAMWYGMAVAASTLFRRNGPNNEYEGWVLA